MLQTITEVEDLLTKNYKILLKKLRKISLNGKTAQVHVLEDNVVKTATAFQIMGRFSTPTFKIPVEFLVEMKSCPQIHTELQEAPGSQKNGIKKEKQS
jgi:hypothetical protein